MRSADYNNGSENHVHPDRLLPMGVLSPRQESVSYLLRERLASKGETIQE